MDDYDGEDDHEEQMAQYRQERFRMMREEAKADDEYDLENMGEDAAIDFDVVQGPLQSWLKRREVVKFIIRQFNNFLKNNCEDKIHEMCTNNLQSLYIIYNEFSRDFPTLAIWLAEEPSYMLPILDQVAMDVLL